MSAQPHGLGKLSPKKTLWLHGQSDSSGSRMEPKTSKNKKPTQALSFPRALPSLFYTSSVFSLASTEGIVFIGVTQTQELAFSHGRDIIVENWAELANWAEEELETVDLKDARLNRRSKKVLSDFGKRPTASIPLASGGHAEMTAAYRFFDNAKVNFEKILQPHIHRTIQRIAANSVVLFIQDTTEFDLTRPGSLVAGAGPMDGQSRQGVFLHILQAFAVDGTPLGTAWAHKWARTPDEPGVTQFEKRKRRRSIPIEAKESFRWVEGLRKVRAISEVAPETTCVCIADSEADIYEMFIEPRVSENGGRLEWIIRACQERPVNQGGITTHEMRLREAALAAPALYTKTISVRGRTSLTQIETRARRQPREDREAVVTIRAATVTLLPPKRKGKAGVPVSVNVVLVREDQPPEGEVPIEWVLVTTLPIGDKQAVETIIEYYEQRWMIEIFFRTLKSGCRVEERRFENLDRLLPCAAVYLIVAWRTLMVCKMGRSRPDMRCDGIFDEAEWKSVYAKVKRKVPPDEPPRLEEMIRLIAQLGGYVNLPGRKDMPGVQTLWLGMQRMRDLAWGWKTFGPGAKPIDV